MDIKLMIKRRKKEIFVSTFLLIYIYAFKNIFPIFGTDMSLVSVHPKDYEMQMFYFLITHILVIVIVWVLSRQIIKLLHSIIIERKFIYIKEFIVPFMIISIVYAISHFINYPGYNQDESLVTYYACNYLPVYWHNYLTSIYYMVAMTLIPTTVAPYIIRNSLFALIFAFFYYKVDKNYQGSKLKYIVYIIAFLPQNIREVPMSQYTLPYLAIMLGLIVYLIMENMEEKTAGFKKLMVIAFFFAIQAVWRPAGLVYLVMSPLLIYFVYKSDMNKKKVGLYTLLCITLLLVIKIPQKIGDEKFYNGDYTVVNTISPLGVILNREQTYEQAQEDIDNINTIIPVNWIRKSAESSWAYQNYNSYAHDGNLTQTFSSPEEQTKYLRSFARLALNNIDLLVKERINVFLNACNVPSYLRLPYNVEIHNAQESDLPEFFHDKEIAYSYIEEKEFPPLHIPELIEKVLYRYIDMFGETYRYFFIPCMLIMTIIAVYCTVKREYLFAIFSIMPVLRMGLVALVEPVGTALYFVPGFMTSIWILYFIILTRSSCHLIRYKVK